MFVCVFNSFQVNSHTRLLACCSQVNQDMQNSRVSSTRLDYPDASGSDLDGDADMLMLLPASALCLTLLRHVSDLPARDTENDQPRGSLLHFTMQ